MYERARNAKDLSRKCGKTKAFRVILGVPRFNFEPLTVLFSEKITNYIYRVRCCDTMNHDVALVEENPDKIV